MFWLDFFSFLLPNLSSMVLIFLFRKKSKISDWSEILLWYLIIFPWISMLFYILHIVTLFRYYDIMLIAQIVWLYEMGIALKDSHFALRFFCNTSLVMCIISFIKYVL